MFCIGPLNLNRQTKKASAAMGAMLYLDEKEFDALYLLASREGGSLTFEQLFAAVWESPESPGEIESARSALGSLAEKVKEAGKGFMWIEHTPESGYTFKIRWKRSGS